MLPVELPVWWFSRVCISSLLVDYKIENIGKSTYVIVLCLKYYLLKRCKTNLLTTEANMRGGLATPQTACYKMNLSLVYWSFWSGGSSPEAQLPFWTFPPMGGVNAPSFPLWPFSWNFISILSIFSHELWNITHTNAHTQLLVPITWTEMASGCGLWDPALIFCCCQLYVPCSSGETYLWLAMVHYPSDYGSCVTAGGVFALQWCWCCLIRGNTMHAKTQSSPPNHVIKRWLVFILALTCEYQTHRRILIYYLVDSVHLQANKQHNRKSNEMWYFPANMYNFKAPKSSSACLSRGRVLPLTAQIVQRKCH